MGDGRFVSSLLFFQIKFLGQLYYTLLLACSVHLVELCGTGHYFAMKAMDKGVMLNRNKVLNTIIEHDYFFFIAMFAFILSRPTTRHVPVEP